jgi:hypothetical protein
MNFMETDSQISDNYIYIIPHFCEVRFTSGTMYFQTLQDNVSTCIILCSPPCHVEAQDMEGGIWNTAIFRPISETELKKEYQITATDYFKWHQ